MSNLASFVGLLLLLFVPPGILAIREYRNFYRYNPYFQLVYGEKLPIEIQNSTLVLNEDEISCKTPYQLYGRVDQVFQNEHNHLVILDSKTRKNHRIYTSDVMQLSLYRYMLSNGDFKQHTFSPYGYIRTVVIHDEKKKTARINRVLYFTLIIVIIVFIYALWRYQALN